MPSPGSLAQRVIDSAQPILALIKTTAKTERMRDGGKVDRAGFLGERFLARKYMLTIAVGHGPDDDPTGTVYARFVFKDDADTVHAMITVFKDVVTGRWITDFSIQQNGSETRDALRIALALGIEHAFTRDIGEPRALLLIEKLADFIVGPPGSDQKDAKASPAF